MENQYTFYQDLAAIFSESPADSIVSRTIVNEADSKIILFSFAPGQELSEHTASMPAILHFVSGEARLTLGEEVHEAKANTWAYMPPKLAHSIQAKTAVSLLLILIKS